MIITPSNITNLQVTFSSAFKEGFKGADPKWNQVASLIPSGGKSNTYGWLGQFPRFREWAGDRVLNNLKAHSYSLVNKSYESTVVVEREEIEDDSTGTYGPIFTEMGKAAAIFPDELVFGAMNAGLTTLCYDGQYMFDVDHPVYPNVDGTGTAVSVANFVAGSNPTWFLIDDSHAIKPFILQQRKAAVFTSMDRIDDESVFTRKQFRYGVDGRWNAGYGLWQQAYASRAALTQANFEAAVTAMTQVKADGGRPLGIYPTKLVVPPSLRSAAENILKRALINAGETNTSYQRTELVMSQWLSDT